jgi:hypothetical protein
MHRIICLLLVLLVGCSKSAELSGKVQDPAGAVVAGATVILKTSNGVELRSRTDAQGNYRFDAVPMGAQTLTVAVRGFQDSSQTIEVQKATRLDVALKLRLDCALATPDELAALGNGPFILLQEWSDFGAGQRSLRLSPAVAEYSSEYFERKGAFNKKGPMPPGRFAVLIDSLKQVQFWEMEPCQGDRGIDSGMKALTVSVDGRKKQVVVENDAPAQVQMIVEAIAKESKLWQIRKASR